MWLVMGIWLEYCDTTIPVVGAPGFSVGKIEIY